MKRMRKITAEEENFSCKPVGRFGLQKIQRDSVKPAPVGTIICEIFRVVGYDPDCDGSLMARLENINLKGETTGWTVHSIGLYPDTTLITTLAELRSLVERGDWI